MNNDQFKAWLARQGKPKDRALERKYYGDPESTVRLKGERMAESDLHNLCLAWAAWCQTRRFFVRPGSRNILAGLQPHKVGSPPDATMSDELSWLNMAIHALADMPDEQTDAECFLAFYWDRKAHIKRVADELEISRRSFYHRKDRFAEKAYSLSHSLRRAHAKMTALPEAIGSDED